MNLAHTERLALCDLLDEVGAEAPTLCEGWEAQDLAAHLWLRETDPLATPGIVIKPLAGLTERRMSQATTKFSHSELVDKVRRGPGRLSVFSLPGMDEAANLAEYFVHHEDVRRAQAGEVEPRRLDPAIEDALWKRLSTMGRAMFRRCESSVVARRSDADGHLVEGLEPLVLKPGEPTVTVTGTPGELLLLAFGRGRHARLAFEGAEGDVERLLETRLGV
ncbi:TIGR03085 family metal-binding protein [Luteococcus peritonei]|uniref:TIGR03085 family metal-binding protein n=1 Tax=Luteococcus peritonei TaxID=88874 RepID=A0ABW4RYM2_9ACTN